MNQDTKAILARREAFVKSVLSKNEASEVKGGNLATISPEPCLSPVKNLPNISTIISVPQPCLSPASIIDVPQPCLSPISIIDIPTVCLSPA
jgi:hypothetical protein